MPKPSEFWDHLAYGWPKKVSEEQKLRAKITALEAEQARAEEKIKRLEAQHNQSEQRLREAIDAMSEGFALFDADDRL